MAGIVAQGREEATRIFDGLFRRQAELARSGGECGWSLRQAASSKAATAAANPRQNEA
jgi:hypothetical protein